MVKVDRNHITHYNVLVFRDMSPEGLSIDVIVTKNSRNHLFLYPKHTEHDLKILVNHDANESTTEHSKQLAYNHGPP